MTSVDRPELHQIHPGDMMTVYTDFSDERATSRVMRALKAAGHPIAVVIVEAHYIPSIDDGDGREIYGPRAILKALRERYPKLTSSSVNNNPAF